MALVNGMKKSQVMIKETNCSVPSTPLSKGVEEGKWLKVLTPNNSLTRISIPLANVKATSDPNELKTKSNIYYIFCISINETIKTLYIEGNQLVMIEFKIFHFHFDFSNDVDKNLKHETEFLIERSKSLAEEKIKNEIHWLITKYKQGNDMHEERKQ